MKEEVVNAVAAWLPAFGLPSASQDAPKDLKGRSFRVARFADENAVRFFFPRRSLIFQQRMVKALTRQLRKRGAEIVNLRLTVEDYARWQQTQDRPDSAELRFHFATLPPEGAGEAIGED